MGLECFFWENWCREKRIERTYQVTKVCDLLWDIAKLLIHKVLYPSTLPQRA